MQYLRPHPLAEVARALLCRAKVLVLVLALNMAVLVCTTILLLRTPCDLRLLLLLGSVRVRAALARASRQ